MLRLRSVPISSTRWECAMYALIIEDEPLVAMVIEQELRSLGFNNFVVADNEADAIAAAEQHCPDLITVDDWLVESPGLDAIRSICADRRIPTVYITADPRATERALPGEICIGKVTLTNTLARAIGRARERTCSAEGDTFFEPNGRPG